MGSLADRLGTVSSALRDDGRGWVLVFVTLGWGLSLGTRNVFPVLFPHIRDAFGVSLSTLGVLFALLWLAYGVGQFPGGALADRFGERAILALSTVLAGATVVAVALSVGVVTLAVSMVLFGFASALYGPTRFTILSEMYSTYDGTAIGIAQAGGHVGNAALPLVAGLLAAYLTWRAGFLYVVPLFALTTVGLWKAIPGATSSATNALDAGSSGSLRYVVFHAGATEPLRLTGIMAFVLFVMQGLTSFYPTYLVDVKGVSPGTAAALFGLLFAVAIVVQPAAGAAGDKLDLRRVLVAFLVVQAGALLALPLATGSLQLVVVTVLLSSFFGISPLAVTRLTAVLPDDMKGAGLGLLRTSYFLVGATGSIFVGTFAEQGLFDEAVTLLAVPIAAAVVLVLTIPADGE